MPPFSLSPTSPQYAGSLQPLQRRETASVTFESNDDTNNTPMIVGIVVALVVLAALITLFVIRSKRRAARLRRQEGLNASKSWGDVSNQFASSQHSSGTAYSGSAYTSPKAPLPAHLQSYPSSVHSRYTANTASNYRADSVIIPPSPSVHNGYASSLRPSVDSERNTTIVEVPRIYRFATVRQPSRSPTEASPNASFMDATVVSAASTPIRQQASRIDLSAPVAAMLTRATSLKRNESTNCDGQDEGSVAILGTYTATIGYQPQMADELGVSTGDSLAVIEKYDDGWALAINLSQGRTKGMFPQACIEAN
ncbi:hypothetical protein H4R35_002243 [Dimargaris xerosporica]|nr:hypothetical protein H4R35_002243 [Dimargaris xerosporica]